MNRDDYRQLVKNTFHDKGWEYYWQHINFPEMLRSVAIQLFLNKDFNTPLAEETHRRLKQLHDTGETDQ